MDLRPKTNVRFDKPREASPTLGRPSSDIVRNVYDDILLAAETCLKSKSLQEISTKEIAIQAGINSAMVSYYFGSKDGLLIEIVRRGLNEMQQSLIKTREAICKNELDNPTRSMIAELINVYNKYPAVCRTLISEVFHEGSPVRSYLVKQWPFHGKKMVVDVLTHLSNSGYYRKDVDVEGVSSMIISVVFFPLVIQHPLTQGKGQVDHYFDDQWIDFTSTVFDSYLRPQG